MADKVITKLEELLGVGSDTQVLAKSGDTVGWMEMSELAELVADGISTAGSAVYVTSSDEETVTLTQYAEYFQSIIVDGEELQDGSVTGALTYTFAETGNHEVTLTLVNSPTTLTYAFQDCTALYSIALPFGSTMTDVSYAFYRCTGMVACDVTEWVMKNVTTCQSTFYGCSSLTTLDVSGWDTSKVTTFALFVQGCSKLTTLDVSGWDTSKVTDFHQFALSCTKLTALDGLQLTAATTIASMCSRGTSLTTINLVGLGTKSSCTTTTAFYNCTAWEYDSVLQTLLTDSYDRATAGYDALTITLPSAVYALLSEDEIAGITAKGFTLAT